MNSSDLSGVSMPARQTGAVLILGLIMMLLMTIVGLAAIRGSGLQEMMAGNMRDRNLAFQAGEGGLAAGEAYLFENKDTLAFDGSMTGLYPDLSKPGKTPIEQRNSDFWTTANALETSLDLANIGTEPLFVIEELDVEITPGSDGGGIDSRSRRKAEKVEYYRVTGRGVGANENTEVIVQSTVKP